MSTEHISTRVNQGRLKDFIGKTVRLTCKTIKFFELQDSEAAIVEASDGGQVEIRLLNESNITDPYVEIIGDVVDDHTIRQIACTNLGSELDMKLVNDVIELIHRFHDTMFA